MRIREAGDSGLVAELDAVIDPAVNARAIGIADAVRAQQVPGVRDVVPTFHSVAVSFDPLVADRRRLHAALGVAWAQAAPPSTGRVVDVPVAYGGEAGPDLADVARFARCTPAEVIERHTLRTYRVFMLGFLPGYAYMASVDEAIAMPRRAMPRLRVPAGSVGIAGRQTGIYPRESPGGWQIIGRTSCRLFDPQATPPALFAPGDEVRFVAVEGDLVSGFNRTGIEAPSSDQVRPKADAAYDEARRYVTVLNPGLLTTIQDEGRWGYQHLGVPVAGPMDAVSHRLANAAVGNPREAATLEATLIGPELRFEHDAWIAVAGADLQPTVDDREAPAGVPVKCRAGSVLRFGARRAGARAYVAVAGGIAVPAVLGSRATHVLSGLGGVDGRAVHAGDRLPLGSPSADLQASRNRNPTPAPKVPLPRGGARLRILRGPEADQFDASALAALQRGRYIVSPQSDRMGYRLSGSPPLPAPPGEMISDAVFMGGLQVPPSGEPILLMADRQTTGGYPQLAAVITADLPLAAQLVPGDWVEFEPCSPPEAIAALLAQEGGSGALG